MLSNIVSAYKCHSYAKEELNKTLLKHFDNLGGIEKYIKKGTKVLLKVNLLMAAKPERAITTHPNIVAELARIITAAGGIVLVADSPGGPYTPEELTVIYRATGMDTLEKIEGVTLNYDCTACHMDYEAGMVCNSFELIKPYFDADLIISVCKLKTHALLGFSGAVNNMFGLVPGRNKAAYYETYPNTMQFSKMLIDLCQAANPALTFMDAIISHEGDGPTGGNAKFTGFTLASENPFALDLAATTLTGFMPGDIPTVAQSVESNLCVQSAEQIDIKGDSINSLIVHQFTKSTTMPTLVPDNVPRVHNGKLIMKRRIPHRPKVNNSKCKGCGHCVESCPKKTIELIDNKAVINMDDCIYCYCCHQVCPSNAIDIKKRYFTRIFG